MIPFVVLAAGLSSRMGRPKALLPIGSDPSAPRETFLSRIVRSAREAGVDDLVVVLGHDADVIRAGVSGCEHGARFVVNREYQRGQLSSLLAGLDAVDGEGVRAMLLTLVDVPFVSPSTIRAVIERYEQTGALVVRPVRGDQHGHPVLIDRSLFAALREADPAIGAKSVVRRFVSPAGDVTVEDRGAFLDVDTMDEYLRISSGGADAV